MNSKPLVPGQKQKAAIWIAGQNYPADTTHALVQKELKQATGIDYTDSNIKLIRHDIKTGKYPKKEDDAKPTVNLGIKAKPPEPEVHPVGDLEQSHYAMGHLSSAPAPVSSPPVRMGVTGADPAGHALTALLHDIKKIKDLAVSVGGLPRLVEIAQQMEIHGI